jgi:nicotinate dehydrogenase subunit A
LQEQATEQLSGQLSGQPSGQAAGPPVAKVVNEPEQRFDLMVNEQKHTVTATFDTPLLYVLRSELELNGPRFGCGLAQCGACTVHIDGKPIRSCRMSVGRTVGHKITTIEGLSATYQGAGHGTSSHEPSALHPVQQAWIDEQVPQCGSCQNGWIMYSAHLLSTVKQPTENQIRNALTGLKCRCGSQVAILRAVRRAAKTMGEA